MEEQRKVVQPPQGGIHEEGIQYLCYFMHQRLDFRLAGINTVPLI